MYSKARVAGHALHPMVNVFPIALYTSTVAALLVYLAARDIFYYRAALIACVAGLAMAILAAIPGAIDRFALPRDSRARAIAIEHASFAILTNGLFALCAVLLWRGWSTRMMVDGEYALHAAAPLAVGMVGMVGMVIARSLGWTLVQTHHVGINPARTYGDRPSREPELDDFDAAETLPRGMRAREQLAHR
jgi:uncharacterized membrane protein